MLIKILLGTLLFVGAVFLLLYMMIFVRWKKRKKFDFDQETEDKRAENYPPPYPNGWFNLCSARDVKKGKVIEVEALGQKFAVFRGEDGKVGVLDVYCPHLNANLAEGCVKGNNVVCPFHGWEFNKEGKCAKIPYSDTVPKTAKTKAWEVKENWGLILIWYHSENQVPTWHTDGHFEEIKNYKFHSKSSDILRIHLQDFAENGADYAHFGVVHNILTIPFAHHFINVNHICNIEFGEGDKSHMAYFTDIAELAKKSTNQKIEHAGGKATVTFFGPGFLIFEFTTIIGCLTLIKTFTPLGKLKVRMEDHVYAPKGTFGLAIKYILGEASAQFHDDISIWEKKNFAAKPLLVKEDGPIMQMRAWYSQFYTENSRMA
ncbi:MAG: cholesterol desaturase daf-36 [Bacteroidota bacterium]|nr:cholesterol desaturase daf-36 [Bacteroidota bacterium]